MVDITGGANSYYKLQVLEHDKHKRCVSRCYSCWSISMICIIKCVRTAVADFFAITGTGCSGRGAELEQQSVDVKQSSMDPKQTVCSNSR